MTMMWMTWVFCPEWGCVLPDGHDGPHVYAKGTD